MQELFRFFAIRAGDPVAPEEHVNLDTQSTYQASLTSPNANASTALTQSRNLIDELARPGLRDSHALINPIRSFKARLDALQPSEDAAPVDEWVKTDLEEDLKTLNERLRAGAEQLQAAAV